VHSTGRPPVSTVLRIALRATRLRRAVYPGSLCRPDGPDGEGQARGQARKRTEDLCGRTSTSGIVDTDAMSAELLSAIAATAAAAISLVNVGLTAFFARRHDSEKWLRDLLPDLVVKFNHAAFEFERKVFATDWSPLNHDERQNLGTDEYSEASKLLDTLEAFVSPETAEAAQDVLYSIDCIKSISYHLVESKEFETWHPQRRAAYWDYAEESYKFILAARSEMGLKPLAVPPGLAEWRKHQAAKAPNDSD
jgi:hypothetical protein